VPEVITTSGAEWITDNLWPGASLSPERVSGAAAELVAVPDASAPTQLLPASWTSVAAVARRPSDDRPRGKALRDAIGVAGLVALSRFDRRRRLTVVGDADASLVAHLRRVVDPRIADAVVLCGPARANRKPVMQLHDRHGRTVAFAKVAWNDLTRALLAREHAALTHLASRTTTGFQCPRVLGSGSFGDAEWLALGPVGVSKRSAPSDAASFAVAREIERTADEWNGAVGANPFVQRLAAAATGLATSAPIVADLAAASESSDLVLRAAHGDFVPWNTLTGTPAPAVWDWERYEQQAPAGYDRFHHVFQTSIFRRGMPVAAAVAAMDARFDGIVPDLGRAARIHLDWYLADLLCRYERDASPVGSPASPETPPVAVEPRHPSLMARVADMATVMEQRRSRR